MKVPEYTSIVNIKIWGYLHKYWAKRIKIIYKYNTVSMKKIPSRYIEPFLDHFLNFRAVDEHNKLCPFFPSIKETLITQQCPN